MKVYSTYYSLFEISHIGGDRVFDEVVKNNDYKKFIELYTKYNLKNNKLNYELYRNYYLENLHYMITIIYNNNAIDLYYYFIMNINLKYSRRIFNILVSVTLTRCEGQ
jgi:hypothetical protein